jgi:hypothetical protein
MPRIDLDQLLARKRALATRTSQSSGLPGRLRDLRAWQAERLARTYDDLRRDPCYARAIDFFLSDLYGPRDTGARDQQLMRASRLLRATLPGGALSVLERAVELDVLNAELDHSMVAVIPRWPIDGAGYAAAYRTIGRRDARERQIDLVVAMGIDLDRIVRRAWIGSALLLARAPARAGGFGLVQDFLESGFNAFRDMVDARSFLETIRRRETDLMQRLFSVDGEENFAPGIQPPQ